MKRRQSSVDHACLLRVECSIVLVLQDGVEAWQFQHGKVNEPRCRAHGVRAARAGREVSSSTVHIWVLTSSSA